MRYDNSRAEMAPYVPLSARRVLDVGCATGGFGGELRARMPEAELWGLDPSPHPEERPQPYDRRLVGTFPEALPDAERFDCIVFNDVLEHMMDPWAALVSARGALEPDGCIVASLPNIRHVSVLKPLVLHGRFDYRDTGLLDRTHLRFFTRGTIADLFGAAAFRVTTLEPVRVSRDGRLARIDRWLGGRLTDFLVEQYAVVASPA